MEHEGMLLCAQGFQIHLNEISCRLHRSSFRDRLEDLKAQQIGNECGSRQSDKAADRHGRLILEGIRGQLFLRVGQVPLQAPPGAFPATLLTWAKQRTNPGTVINNHCLNEGFFVGDTEAVEQAGPF
jgi:hypothetical protein